MKLRTIFITIIFTLFCLGLLALGIKGNVKDGKVYYQTENSTQVGGPFEASNSTARFALTESIVEDKKFTLSLPLAKFAAPDLVDYKGKFMSIFTPGISFLGIPFYMIGKTFGLQQLFTYSVVLLFSVINMLLIAKLAGKFGAGKTASLLSGFIFLFATNGLIYAFSFTQHHVSVTIILLTLFNVLGKRNFLTNTALGLLIGFGMLVDIPNLFLLFPLVLYALIKHIQVEEINEKIKINLKLSFVTIVLGLLPFIGVFAYYNHATTGSYVKISQFMGRTQLFRDTAPSHLTADVGGGKDDKNTSFTGQKLPFNTRIQLAGFYTLLLSNERAWIYYSPIVLLGIVGFVLAYLKLKTRLLATLAISIALLDVVLYSMFGDAWGGWAFGPRYLIPAAALLCGGIGIVIETYGKNILFAFGFFLLFFYSLYVNILGATTASTIPPKVEAVNLSIPIPYTYEYNQQLVLQNRSSSLVYNRTFQQYFSLQTYIIFYTLLGGIVGVILYLNIILQKLQEEKQ